MRRARWMWRLVLAAVPLVLASTGLARQAEIVLKDGRRITGELVSQTPHNVVIKIANIETTYPREQIRDMQVKLTLEEQYQQRKAALKPDDFDGRYGVARWAFDQNTPEAMRLAVQELDSILAQRPDHPQAKLLRSIIAEQAAKRVTPPPTEPAPPTTPPPGKTDAKEAPAAGPGPKLLTKEDQNLIKVYEVDLATKPRVAIPDKVVTDFLKAYRESPELREFVGREARFKTLDGWQQLDLIFKAQAREFYPAVMVREDPKSIRDLRTKYHPNYLVRYCGTCHGEGKAAGLYIITRNPQSDDVMFTNYMSVRRGVSGRGFPLIDKANPSQSPLLQYGLPPRDATVAHPDVRGMRHYFTGSNDPRYHEMVEWIKSLYGQSSSDYPIEFTPVGGAAPARNPATQPVPPAPGATAPGAPPIPAPGVKQ